MRDGIVDFNLCMTSMCLRYDGKASIRKFLENEVIRPDCCVCFETIQAADSVSCSDAGVSHALYVT